MNRFSITALMLLCMISTSAQKLPHLQRTVDSLYIVDQQIQRNLLNAINSKLSFDSIQKLQELEKLIFDKHVPIIKEIFKKYGYPTKKLVGEECSSHYFILIQHADSDSLFQSEMLPVLEKLSRKSKYPSKIMLTSMIGYSEILVANNCTELNYRLMTRVIYSTSQTLLFILLTWLTQKM